MKKSIIAMCLLAALTVSPIVMTGCDKNEKLGVSSTSDEESNGIEWALVAIKSESDVDIFVSDHEAMNDLTGRVKGAEIKGDLITQTTTCADFGDSFDATYDVKGEHLEDAVFHIKPVRQQTENFCNYGMNYFELIQKISTKNCEEVSVKYKEMTNVTGQQGEFEIVLYPASKKLADKLGYSSITVKGDTGDKKCDITCKMTDDGFSFTSTEILNVTVERATGEKDESGKDVSVVEKYDNTAVFDYVVNK